MDKLSREILKDLNTRSADPAAELYDWNTDMAKLAARIGTPIETIRAAIRYMHEEHYIKYLYDQHDRNCGFQLDHKGLHYKEFTGIDRREFWFKCVLTPIVVSVVASAITTFLIA